MINWWNCKTIQTSPLLWKPTFQPLSSTLINTKTWFSTVKQEFNNVNGNVPIPIVKELPEETIYKCKKIKLNPDLSQRQQLARWWNDYRFTYNKTIEAIIDDVSQEKDYGSFKIISNLNITQDNNIHLELGCQLEPERNIKLNIKLTQPKIKATITIPKPRVKKVKEGETATSIIKKKRNIKVKEKKLINFKIKIIDDPEIKPLNVSLDFEYPQSRSWMTYRNELVTASGVENQYWYLNNTYILDTNKNIRTGAVKQAISAYKSICSNAKNNGTKGSLRSIFQKKKKQSWSMNLTRDCVSKTQTTTKKGKLIDAIKICPSIMKTPIKCWEKFEEIGCDPKIHKDKWNDYWLIVPIKQKNKPMNKTKPLIALDAGEKTFMTGYSTNGHILNCGINTRNVMLETLTRIDCLQSNLDKKLYHGKRTIRYIKYKIEKLWKRIVHLKDDLHWKTINELVKNYSQVIIGKLNVKSILRGSISKSVKRVLQQQGHYQFKTRLLHKGIEQGVYIKEWSEWGTTKGCPCCGKRNEVIGRVFECSGCQYTADRDAKAACSIMLKYLTSTW